MRREARGYSELSMATTQSLRQTFHIASISDLILCHLSPRTLVWLLRTCRMAHQAVTRFLQHAYNINRHLSRYFQDPLQFRSLQAHTGLVISGSNALQFLDRTSYPESDLDLYAHPGHLYELMEWLESTGYNFTPSAHQAQDWHKHVSADWDGTATRFPRTPCDGLDLPWYPDIAAVYTFKQLVVINGEATELKVQVIETICNPIKTILKFHSSLSNQLFLLCISVDAL